MLRFDYFFPAFGQITDMDTAGSSAYAHKVHGLIPKKVYGVTPIKVYGI